jgi:hypothetical protein
MLILAPKAHYFHIEQAAFTALGRALGTARFIDRVRGAISFHFQLVGESGAYGARTRNLRRDRAAL